MKENNAKDLLAKYAAGECTAEEKAIVESWYLQQQHQSVTDMPDTERLDDMQEIRNKLLHEINGTSLPVRRLWPRIAAAASMLLVLSISGYFLLHKQTNQQLASNYKKDLAPGSNKAILTLSNGKQIDLKDAKNGTIAKEGNETIKKSDDGTLSYEGHAASGVNEQVTYNMVTTPRGGQWPLILTDGTKVMLDAASSIKYPVSFNGNERRVEITGQAYFEVAHHAKPFKVGVRGVTIEDLGTHFNINAYNDEPAIKTTLLEGSVRVSKGKEIAVLKPGQQASTLDSSNLIKVYNADVEEAVAWKNGYFRYESIELKELMRQVSRWYDVDVSYEGPIAKHKFLVDMKRKTNLSNILKILEQGGIHFKITGRKLTVMP